MGQLFFKKPLQDAIREGRKRTTIRRWDRPRVRVGEEAFAPGLGWLVIEQVGAIELESLADADAQVDGFANVPELLAVLLALYPDYANDGKRWFRVTFTLSRTVKTRRAIEAERQPALFP
jgi:hypothetical protein